jgi:glycosyltransferase involved in cell wall biosynthesis
VCSCRGNDISKDIFIDPQTVATVLQRSTHLVFVCDSLLHMAETLVPCRQKSTVVANAVDCTTFTPVPSSARRTSSPVIVGTSGLMRWKKGLDLLLPLVRELCEAEEVRFLVAGYGLDAEVDRQIADFLDAHRLRERFEMCGPIPHTRMGEALHRMDMYVTTSYQEGMPNGVLEAMACALPVVATAADGIPALVVHGVTGYLCAMGDLAALVARCRQLVHDPALRRRLGEAGRQRVQHHFQPAREVAAVEGILLRAAGTL